MRATQKTFWNDSAQPGLRGSNDLHVGRKMAILQLFFQSREQAAVRRGQIWRIGLVIKTLEAQVVQFLMRCKWPVSRGIVVQEQDPLVELTAAFCLQNVLQLHEQRWVILRVVSLALWKMPSWSQKIKVRTFPADFCTWNFCGGLSGHAATPLIVVLSTCHSDITRFRPWSPTATGNHLDSAKKFQNLFRWLQRWRFWSAFKYFGTHFAESFHMSKSLWMMDKTLSRDMPSSSALDLAEILRSSKISSLIWLIISGVVTVLGRPGRGATQVEKSTRLNRATLFSTVADDGAYSPNISIRITWIFFGALPCGGK